MKWHLLKAKKDVFGVEPQGCDKKNAIQMPKKGHELPEWICMFIPLVQVDLFRNVGCYETSKQS